VYDGVEVDGHDQVKEATVEGLPSCPCAFSGVMAQ
jgi:hypothetical protein